jgi:hypothetical protein
MIAAAERLPVGKEFAREQRKKEAWAAVFYPALERGETEERASELAREAYNAAN